MKFVWEDNCNVRGVGIPKIEARQGLSAIRGVGWEVQENGLKIKEPSRCRELRQGQKVFAGGWQRSGP